MVERKKVVGVNPLKQISRYWSHISVTQGSETYSSEPQTYIIDSCRESDGVELLRQFYKQCTTNGAVASAFSDEKYDSGVFPSNPLTGTAKISVPAGRDRDKLEYKPLAELIRNNGHLEFIIHGHKELIHNPNGLYCIGRLLTE
ncbi:MAG: hypothetical protein AABX51_02680 [Nanoarchaeota archaeon]